MPYCFLLAFLLWPVFPALAQQDVGIASYYAAVPDPSEKFSAAHRTLPFGTMVMVTRVETGTHVTVRINDRGPFVRGRIIDVSRAAAEQIGMISAGTVRVEIQVIPVPLPASKIVHERESGFRCPSCTLPPIFE
jgi:rare lipoprotein A